MSKVKQDIYDILVEHIVANQEKYYRIAYCYVYDKDAALDIIQNAICKALENYNKVRSEKAVKTWFYRIVINESLQYIRKNKREIVCEPSDMKEEVYYETAYEPKLELYRKVCALPEQMKAIVILHYFEQLTLKEIAEATGVNLNTVKSRLYAALRQLKCEMEVEA